MKPSRMLTGSQFWFVESPCLIRITLRRGRETACNGLIKSIQHHLPPSLARPVPAHIDQGVALQIIDHGLLCAWPGPVQRSWRYLRSVGYRANSGTDHRLLPTSSQQPASSNTSCMAARVIILSQNKATRCEGHLQLVLIGHR